jgi:O-antigen ligase
MLFVFLSLLCWVYESSRLDIPLSDWFILHKHPFAFQMSFSIVYSWFGYNHPTYHSIEYLIAIASGFYLFNRKKNESIINAFELVSLVISSFVLNTIVQSRICLIGLILITGIGIASLIYQKRKLFIGYVSCCIIVAFISVQFFSSRFSSFVTDPAREQLYTTAFNHIKSNVILGTGIGGLPAIMESNEIAKSLGYPSALDGVANPHNQFVGDLMQVGVFGLLVIVFMLASLFYTSLRKRNWMLFTFLLIFTLIMSIEMPLYLLKGTTFFVPFVCLFLQWNKKELTYKTNV